MFRKFTFPLLAFALMSSLCLSAQSSAADGEPEVRFHDGRFEPASFAVTANHPLHNAFMASPF